MSDRSGLSRGDRNRNERLARVREAVPVSNAVVGIDLADRVQAVVVVDRESRVLARRRVKARAWQLGATLDWAVGAARAAGFAGVSVACEPTGHRWRIVDQLAAQRGLALVCVSPMLVARSREQEDLSPAKTDDRDAVLIARLALERRCYLPERADPVWGRLRQLGARRVGLVAEAGGCVQQVRDLLECVWPAVLDAAAKPAESKTWCAALAVVLDRVGACGQLGVVARLGRARFRAAVRAQLPRWGTTRLIGRIADAVFDALSDPTGVAALRPGALERAGLVLADWQATRARLAETETRMLAVLDELALTDLVATIDGLSPLGAAAILAETGDPTRFATGRAVVKHAGLAPAENTSGTYRGRTRLSGRGRPKLRLAAWRAIWGAIHTNAVYAARFTHLTTRPTNPLTPQQARAALAAALLRQLHAVITTGQAWNPAIAAGGRHQSQPTAA